MHFLYSPLQVCRVITCIFAKPAPGHCSRRATFQCGILSDLPDLPVQLAACNFFLPDELSARLSNLKLVCTSTASTAHRFSGTIMSIDQFTTNKR